MLEYKQKRGISMKQKRIGFLVIFVVMLFSFFTMLELEISVANAENFGAYVLWNADTFTAFSFIFLILAIIGLIGFIITVFFVNDNDK